MSSSGQRNVEVGGLTNMIVISKDNIPKVAVLWWTVVSAKLQLDCREESDLVFHPKVRRNSAVWDEVSLRRTIGCFKLNQFQGLKMQRRRQQSSFR